MMDRKSISMALDASVETIGSLRRQLDAIERVCDIVVSALKSGNKVLTAGNGGSAAEALHMSEELVGRFRGNRVSLPGIALVADCTALTCIGNDFGFDHIFSRQIEGLGSKGDVLVLFSTSGNAENLLRAVAAAKVRKMTTVALLGRDGGCLVDECDYAIVVPGDATERIQEAHQVLLHIVLEEVERSFSIIKDK
jgi:D-sedoheptulose 7-phosphate isomerase